MMKDNQAEKDLENAIAQAIAANPEFNQKVAGEEAYRKDSGELLMRI